MKTIKQQAIRHQDRGKERPSLPELSQSSDCEEQAGFEQQLNVTQRLLMGSIGEQPRSMKPLRHMGLDRATVYGSDLQNSRYQSQHGERDRSAKDASSIWKSYQCEQERSLSAYSATGMNGLGAEECYFSGDVLTEVVCKDGSRWIYHNCRWYQYLVGAQYPCGQSEHIVLACPGARACQVYGPLTRERLTALLANLLDRSATDDANSSTATIQGTKSTAASAPSIQCST